ncbi:MAG: hypothetical protein ACRCWJ_23765 [Casimicrobium sp.]
MPLVCMREPWVVADVPMKTGDDAWVDAHQARSLVLLRLAYVVDAPDPLRVANAQQLALARTSEIKPCCGN